MDNCLALISLVFQKLTKRQLASSSPPVALKVRLVLRRLHIGGNKHGCYEPYRWKECLKKKSLFFWLWEAVFSILHFLSVQLFQTFSLLHISLTFFLILHSALLCLRDNRSQPTWTFSISLYLSNYLHPYLCFAFFFLWKSIPGLL